MVEKKLLTVASAVGILACGACFLPPLPEPAPPLRNALRGVRTIQITAANDSPSHHIDPSGLAQALMQNLNWKTSETGATAFVTQKAGVLEGAALAITILSEDGKPIPLKDYPSLSRWKVVVKISATLTRQDGSQIWQETGTEYSVDHVYPRSGAPWDDSHSSNLLASELADRLIGRMLKLR